MCSAACQRKWNANENGNGKASWCALTDNYLSLKILKGKVKVFMLKKIYFAKFLATTNMKKTEQNQWKLKEN